MSPTLFLGFTEAYWSLFLYWCLPLLVVSVGILSLLLLSVFLKPSHELPVYRVVSSLVLLAAMGITLDRLGGSPNFSTDMIHITKTGLLFSLIVLGASFLTVWIVPVFSSGFKDLNRPELYTLVLLSSLGMSAMTYSTNLLFIFISLELASIGFYLLIAMRQSDFFSNEASLKYFILGSLASAILLFGMAFYYGATGSLNMGAAFDIQANDTRLYLSLSLLMLFSGFSFKLALFPFYFWAPDVYQGSPTVLTGWMASAMKAAGFSVLLFFFMHVAKVLNHADNLLLVSAGLTMLIGNLLALKQSSLKRILACSSIAHAGYALIGVAATVNNHTLMPDGQSAVLFYLLIYMLMTMGAFYVLSFLSASTQIDTNHAGRDDLQLSHLRGLAKRNPWLALMFSIFAFSLAGLPPTAGFMAKYTLLVYAAKQHLYSLVFIAILSSLIGVYYYLRMVSAMYFEEPTGYTTIKVPGSSRLSFYGMLALLAIAILYLGVFPSDLLSLTLNAAAH